MPVTSYQLGVTYAGVVIFGIPTYLVLRSGKWTNFWIAPIVGFIVGMVMWYVTFALFEIVLGHTWSYALSSVATADAWAKALRLQAPLRFQPEGQRHEQHRSLVSLFI